MKTMMLAAAFAALASPALAAPAPVDRIASPAPDGKPGLILKGAIVPAGYETFYLSGQVADPIDPATPGPRRSASSPRSGRCSRARATRCATW